MNWIIVAVFLAGTVVSVLSQQCRRDAHCEPTPSQCCVAYNLDQLIGVGACRPRSRFGQPCSDGQVNNKGIYYCGCTPDTLACRVSDPRFENVPNRHRYLRCTFADEGSGADIKDDDTEKEDDDFLLSNPSEE